jgi:parallel beta-helix repeat protein
MRNSFVILLLCFSLSLSGTTYYVATPANGGKDSNSGKIDTPFATWGKLSSVLVAGDIAYIRGGTYRSTGIASDNAHVRWESLKGTITNTIEILAYPGETPILNLDNITPTASYCFVLFMNGCNYVHVKGLRITGCPQGVSGNNICGMYISNSPNCVFEQCVVDNIGGYGISLASGSDNILFKNCDTHHCSDPYTGYENANGFGITGGSTATNITFDGCRAWKCSDDGWDFLRSDGVITINNCWSFWNGYDDSFKPLGDGQGFKLGPTVTNKSTTHLRTLTNCIAAKNKASGFDQNTIDYSGIMYFYNNIGYNNGWAGFSFNYLNGIANVFRNNIAYGNDYAEYLFGTSIIQSNNTWNGGVTVSTADFVSIDETELEALRKANGSLPDINFLHVVKGSRLIDAGVDVGINYSGNAPDLGAFER